MDKLTIINKALLKIGLSPAPAIGDLDWNGNFVFEQVKEQCLRSHCWGFSQRFAPLSQAGNPVCGFTKAYHLPTDCIRVCDSRCSPDLRDWPLRQVKVIGRLLYANASPVYLRYVSRDCDLDDWPNDFVDAVACGIACEIAPLAAQASGIIPQLVQMYAMKLAEAQKADAMESYEKAPQDLSILYARGGVGDGGRR